MIKTKQKKLKKVFKKTIYGEKDYGSEINAKSRGLYWERTQQKVENPLM